LLSAKYRFYRLWLRHQTSATKLRCSRSSVFCRVSRITNLAVYSFLAGF